MLQFTDTTALDWQPDTRSPSVTLKVLATRADHPHASVVLARVAPGGQIPPHAHAQETETAYVLSGEGVIYDDETPHPLRAGMAVTIPVGTRHRVENPGSAPLELLAIHTPPVR